jgi:hypothetical protein
MDVPGTAPAREMPSLAPPIANVMRPLIALDGVAKTYRTQDGEVESLKPLTF